METVLTITFPIFALIGMGYSSVKLGLFAAGDIRALGQFVLNFALPALLFNAVARDDLTAVLIPQYMLVYLLAGLGTAGAIYALVRAQGTGPARRAIAVLGSTASNSGYIGFPMFLLAFPDRAHVLLAMNMLVENFVILPLSFAMLEMSRPRAGGSAIGALLRAGLGVLRRPMVIGLLAGFAVSFSGVPLPDAAERLTQMLAQSTSALALFFIGGSLVGIPVRGNRLLSAQIVLGKLVLHPAMALLALAGLGAMGWPDLPADLAAAAVLSCAVPMLGIYAVLAQDYGHEALAALTLLVTTIAAFFTLSALLAVLL